ncbi:hypothetical protein [Gordonia aquimaris]|jgi:hypothetical protein|uniref:Uncharacterized protein n=1 Tax=Gordonia aquimaris TaxID=2984863 RepID=A0A9X3D7A0_9ACTN|nr:hypothetical protein [Gordonia aquimaris]MCX2966489.1 hypothetical protein [Gordonia aquimaris]
MTENIDGGSGGYTNRVAPTRGRAALADLTLIVRPPGQAAGVRVYTRDQAHEAEAYAAETGAAVEQLP